MCKNGSVVLLGKLFGKLAFVLLFIFVALCVALVLLWEMLDLFEMLGWEVELVREFSFVLKLVALKVNILESQ